MKNLKNIRSIIASAAFAAALFGCGTSGSHDACIGRQNSDYHISYFEVCGNSEKPVTNGRERTVTLWVEVDSPFSAAGTAWIDDIHLEKSDQPGVNLIPNPSFSGASNPSFSDAETGWRHLENAMCLSSDTRCQNIHEFTKGDVWSLDGTVFHSSPAAAKVDMSMLGLGYQTHIFWYPLLRIDGIAAGVEFTASAYVKLEGDIQARLGIDFRETEVDPNNPRASISSAVNGRIMQGRTDWTVLRLR